MAVERLNRGRRNKIPVLEFNPWEISGHGDIIAAFLNDLGTLLPKNAASTAIKRMGETSEKIKRYAKLIKAGGGLVGRLGRWLVPVAPTSGTAIEITGEAAASAASAAQEVCESFEDAAKEEPLSLAELKADIVKGMSGLKTPILAVIDDIDRLTTDEIREVFQLVKANANFPNLIFLLMFDRIIVGRALDAVSGNHGDEFLDKIVQVPFDVPEPSFSQIRQALFSALNLHLEDKAIRKHWNQDRWSDLWQGGMSAYFRTLRQVYRFLGPFEFLIGQMRAAGGFELNFVDMLGIETLRVFEPALYNRVRTERDLLCGSATRWVYDEKQAEATIKGQFETLLSLVSESRRRQVQSILRVLFPRCLSPKSGRGEVLLRSLCVGHEKTFARYFVMGVPDDDIAESAIDDLLRVAGDPEKMESLWSILTKEGKANAALDRLGVYREQIPRSAFPGFITAMSNIAESLPDDDPPAFFLTRRPARNGYFHVQGALSNCVEDLEERLALLKSGISASRGVRLPLYIATFAERRPDTSPSEYLVSENGAGELIALVLEKLRAAAAEKRLRKCLELGRILYCWSKWAGPEEVKQWVTGELHSKEDALWFLAFMVHTSTSHSERTTYRRTVSLDAVEQWAGIDTIAALTNELELDSLPKEQMWGLRAFRWAKKRKAEEKPHDDSYDPWDDDPLTDYE
jgi:predicted KAP-like P-loop ATPase